MSWFSFGKEFSVLWDSYGTVNNIVTGQFIGDCIFEKKVAKTPSYLKIKNVIADSFCERAKVRFKPASRIIARRILRKNIKKDALSAVWQGLTTKIKEIPQHHLVDQIKYRLGIAAPPLIDIQKSTSTSDRSDSLGAETAPSSNPPHKATCSRLARLRSYFKNNYEKEDSEEIKALLDEWRIKDFLHVSMYLILRPICEPAVLEAVGSASKLGAGAGIDFAARKATTMTTLPALSWLFSTAASWTYYFLKEQIDQCPFAAHGSKVISYLPSTTTILTLSTGYHLAEIAYIWHTTHHAARNTNEDKKQVRQLAMDYIEKPLAEKIQNNAATHRFGIKLSQATADKIAAKLIDKTIDHYWQTLSETSFLGMPLVS